MSACPAGLTLREVLQGLPKRLPWLLQVGAAACSSIQCWCAGRTLLEVLQDFPSAAPPLAWLLQAGPRLLPRCFSIASSAAAHPGEARALLQEQTLCRVLGRC